jgi:hypothetical protein
MTDIKVGDDVFGIKFRKIEKNYHPPSNGVDVRQDVPECVRHPMLTKLYI